MKDVCARAGCNAPAAAAFVTHVPDCTAWLVDLGGPVEGVPLCNRHLSRFSVPVGWTMIDERGADAPTLQPLVQPATPEPASPPTAPEPKAATDDSDAASGDVDASDDPNPGESQRSESDEDHLWRGPDHAQDEVTSNASSPLLSRAFLGPDDGTGDQRRLAIFQRSTRKNPATLTDDELPFPPSDDAPVTNR